MEVVIDASVVVKWFVEEENSDKAIRLRDRYVEGEISIVAPELIIFETLNALKYKRLFSVDELMKVAETLEAFSFTLYPLKDAYARKTIEIAVENNITIYDASYIALAAIKNTTMYTADKKLITQLKQKYRSHVKNIKDT